MAPSYQLSLFSESGGGGQILRAEHVGALVPAVKSAMQRALAAAVPPLSRAQVVDRMNAIAERHGVKLTTGRARLLTIHILDKWLAPNDRDDEPPLKALEVFMLAVQNLEPLECLAEFNGCKLLTPDEYDFYKYGKAKFEAKEHARHMRRMEENIAERRKGGR
jgi:hypothetical protein